MGTKIEYSINLLASSVEISKKFTEGGVDVWEHYQNNHCSIGVNNNNKLKHNNSMDRKLDRNNIESIKKTMQMHEDIFKHQVRELHRVYNVQKILMEDLKKETKQKKLWNPMNGIGIGTTSHIPHLLQQNQTSETSYVQSLRHDLLSCSKETIKIQRGFDLEMPSNDHRDNKIVFGGCDEEALFQSCNNNYNNNNKTSNNDGFDEENMEVDLTLSIGSSKMKNEKKKSNIFPLESSPNGKNREMNSSVSFQSDKGVGDCSDPTTPISSSSVTFDQERKGPHWFSQQGLLKLK